MQPEQIILEPLITEKALGERPAGRYVFRVHLQANKLVIKQAVEKIFKVKVAEVNTAFIRARKRLRGQTSRGKKAYVTLLPGQKITELEG